MDTNADTVEGSGHNVREDDCILNRPLEMKESFAGFLNVPLISDVLVKIIEAMFEAPKPCLNVVKERNYQAEYKGNEIYYFYMRDRGVIVQLSAF
ncbi:unnamed protein product [Penicillium camemberti]|uniref:Str. FM013 n=1 Tax=Penicillium camemberti (strain FM 013) TaxID=1429867 RepID=A0A0G4PT01_PENC3|nr:unnamed protein product [Penicillium camemberti]